MKLAAAQTKPKRGDIGANMADHYRFIEQAADRPSDLIVFPEMSITGYERERADEFAFTFDDPRFDSLRKLSIGFHMVIIAGAPVRIQSKLFIGSFVFSPNNAITLYTKQFLHPGEETSFHPSTKYNPLIDIGNEKVSLAICADIDHPQHPENAKNTGSSLYIPSIFFSPKGIPEAHASLAAYAKTFSLNILMSNFSGESWGSPAGGRSAFWDSTGTLIAELDEARSGLLFIESVNDAWAGECIYL